MQCQHLLIIPDGNRRWAKQRNLLPWKGHEKGGEVFKQITKDVFDFKIKYFTFWILSKDNFVKRPKNEIKTLIDLINRGIQEFYQQKWIKDYKVNIKFYGQWKEYFDKKIVKNLEKIEAETESYKDHFLSILLLYDGREELVAGIKWLHSRIKNPNEISFETIKQCLWTHSLPDVDLIIRTGINNDPHWSSNLLMFQTGYSQFYFTKTLWPDFNKNELKKALQDFAKREKRLGG